MLLTLMLAALNLRPALTSVAPLMERIIAELNLSGATAGLVTTIPVLLMGLLAPVLDVAFDMQHQLCNINTGIFAFCNMNSVTPPNMRCRKRLRL